jgi:hypothetical protein
MKHFILILFSIIMLNGCAIYDEPPIVHHYRPPHVVYYQKYPYYYYRTPKYHPKPQPKRYNRPPNRNNIGKPIRK